MSDALDRKRLRRCGASHGEVAFLVDEHANSDLVVQAEKSDFYRRVADGDLRAHLDQRRTRGDFANVVEPPSRLVRLFRREDGADSSDEDTVENPPAPLTAMPDGLGLTRAAGVEGGHDDGDEGSDDEGDGVPRGTSEGATTEGDNGSEE